MVVVIATSAAAKSSAAWPAWPVENMYSGVAFPKELSYPFPKEVTKVPAWPSPESKYPMYPTPEVGKYPAWPDSKG